jgi:hypothetical protein
MPDTSRPTGRCDASQHFARCEVLTLVLILEYDAVSTGEVTDDWGQLVAFVLMV